MKKHKLVLLSISLGMIMLSCGNISNTDLTVKIQMKILNGIKETVKVYSPRMINKNQNWLTNWKNGLPDNRCKGDKIWEQNSRLYFAWKWMETAWKYRRSGRNNLYWIWWKLYYFVSYTCWKYERQRSGEWSIEQNVKNRGRAGKT